MTSVNLDVDPGAWYKALTEFVKNHCERDPLLDGHMLDPLRDWQRRITGGALLSFLEYATSDEALERYPILAKDPLTERIFVAITDIPGAIAFNEIIDKRSDKATWLFKEEWRAFLDREDTDHDDDFSCHYEFWSVWHRAIDPRWEIPPGNYQQLWVHEEGFVLADEAGRGSQNVWNWNGQRMMLVEQDITCWVS